MIPDAVAELFRTEVQFVPVTEHAPGGDAVVCVEWLGDGDDAPEHLKNDNLPLLALPHNPDLPAPGSRQVVIAVEGADRRMADAVAGLLSTTARIALVHVTWLPGIVSSPLEEGGIDNPHPQDLLAYRGAREALVDTANELRSAGFEVTTHLRESRDPAGPIGTLVQAMNANLLALGLGRHGAGIGRRLSRRVHVPQLFLRAR